MPATMRELTKNFMMKDIKNRSKEDIAWFIEQTEAYTKETRNPQTGEKLNTPDWAFIKQGYARKFYPELLEKKTAKKPAKKPLTTAEKLAELKALSE